MLFRSLPTVLFGDMQFGNNDYWTHYDASVDRIEAVRGGSSSTFASQAPGAVTVLVVGAADSGLLAIAAHACAKTGMLSRARFAVVDRCDTPLALCRDFAVRHGLDLTTRVATVERLPDLSPAQLVIVHSLLRFVPPETRLD